MQRGYYREYSDLQDSHWWFVGRRRILLRLLEDRRARLPSRAGRVLDFGCGPGGWLPHLDRFGEVSAVDADEDAVRLSHARGRGETLHVEAGEPLPFPDGTFDLVTGLDVLEHVRDDVAAVRELGRVVASDGLVLVTVPAFRFLWGDQDEVSHHFRRYTARSLRAALEEGGLVVEHLSYFNTVLFPVVAAVRVARRLVRAPRGDRSDFDATPAWANGLLTRLLGSEARPVSRRGLPLGVSLVALAGRRR